MNESLKHHFADVLCTKYNYNFKRNCAKSRFTAFANK